MTAEYTAGLLKWVQQNTSGFNGVEVKNFRAESWKDGLAFCALGARWRPDLVNFETLNPADVTNNVRLGFYAAEQMGVPLLLDAEDVEFADEKSYIAQLSEFYNVLKDVPPASGGASVAEPGSGFEGNAPATPQNNTGAQQSTFATYEQQQQQQQEDPQQQQEQPQTDNSQQDQYQYPNNNAPSVSVNVTTGANSSYSNPYAQGNSYNSDYANPVIPSGASAPATGNAFRAPVGGANRGGASLASQPVSTSSGVHGNGATGPDIQVFKQIRGILRIVIWCFALMTFAIMSSQTGYDQVSELQFVMAMAILCWLWISFVIGCYLFQWKVNKYSYADYQLTVELIMDVIWFVLVFISACVGAHKCQEDINGTRLCANAHAAEGSIAMAFFASFALAPAIFFSLRARREGQWAGAKSTTNPYATNINVNVTVQPGPGGQGQIV